MIDKLTFSKRGHTILLANTGLGLLNGLIDTGKMCEYAEDSTVVNFITETRKKVYPAKLSKPSTTWNQESIFRSI